MKELQSWQLVRMSHLPDDRRDYFSTPDDLWEIVRTLVEQRKQREIDPTLTKLRELQMAVPQSEADRHAHARIAETVALIELLTGWYDDVSTFETERLVQLLKLGAGIQGLIGKAASVVPLKSKPKTQSEA